jgi:hypothetical protein
MQINCMRETELDMVQITLSVCDMLGHSSDAPSLQTKSTVFPQHVQSFSDISVQESCLNQEVYRKQKNWVGSILS